MSWIRVDIGTKLLMAVGEASPVVCTGMPLYFRDAADTISQTPAKQYNVSGFYSGATKPIYDDIVTIHGSGGVGLWSTVNALTVGGDTLKIWNANLGQSVYLEIRRQNSSTAQFRTVNHDTPTEWRTLTDFTQPSQGYGSMPEPCMNIGFLQNEDDNTIVLLTQRTYSNNANTYHYYYINSAAIDTVDSANFIIMLSDIPPQGQDPYESHNNNYDTPIGGEGDYDETSDTIAEGTLPTYGGNTSGMCTAYVPTLQQINALANRLADPTVYQVLGNTILKMDDIIIGLSIFPFAVPKIAATHQLRVNLVGVYLPSGLYIDKADGQYHEINCGSLEVKEFWGNCLDYNPYTKVSIYLPFCGFYELDTDDVMGKTLTIKYRVDIMTGTCLASIIVNGSVMYQYAGQCSSQIPISSVSFDSFMQSVISVGVATATGGAGLAAAGANAALGDARANMAGMAHADVSQYQHESVRANFHKTVVDTQSSIQSAAANSIMSAKGQYKHAGAMTGIAGFMGAKKPYLIIKRPNQAIPSDYGFFHGYPSNTKAVLGDLEGYTVVDDIRLNIPEATVEEIIECEKLLKGGIII